MVDAGDYPERNQKFLENLTHFLNDHAGIQVNKIFITHAHYDHFGGVFDVLNLFKSYKMNEPEVYKYLDGNNFESEVFARYPSLKS